MCIKGKNTPILYKESNELIRPDLYILPVNGGYTVFNLNVVYDARSVRFEQIVTPRGLTQAVFSNRHSRPYNVSVRSSYLTAGSRATKEVY